MLQELITQSKIPSHGLVKKVIKSTTDDIRFNMIKIKVKDLTVKNRDFRYRGVQLRFGSSFWFTLAGQVFKLKLKQNFMLVITGMNKNFLCNIH